MDIVELPERLIASQRKTEIVKENACPNCTLNRRTDIPDLKTPGDEIEADAWKSVDIFGMSLNIYLCNTDQLEIESSISDVQYIVKDYTKFESDQQLTNLVKPISALKSDNAVIRFLIKDIETIKGDYPFAKGTPDEVIHNYKASIVYDPLVLNGFHYLIEILSDESGEWKRIKREEGKKKYIRSLATDIRSQIIDNKLVEYQPLN